MLEIMILICRLALATTGMLDGHRTKSINLPALQALWRMVEWGLHPEIATHWSQQRAKPAGGKLSASSCGSRTSWLGAVTKATQSRCSPRHQPEPSPYTSSVPQHQHTSRAGLVPAHPATSLEDFLCICRRIIQYTHGKTRTLLAWILTEGGTFFTSNSAASRIGTPSPSHPSHTSSLCCWSIFFAFMQVKTPYSAFSTVWGAGRMGKRSHLLHQTGLCIVLSQITGTRQEI